MSQRAPVLGRGVLRGEISLASEFHAMMRAVAAKLCCTLLGVVTGRGFARPPPPPVGKHRSSPDRQNCSRGVPLLAAGAASSPTARSPVARVVGAVVRGAGLLGRGRGFAPGPPPATPSPFFGCGPRAALPPPARRDPCGVDTPAELCRHLGGRLAHGSPDGARTQIPRRRVRHPGSVPEDALLWSAEEFDFPPSPRTGPGDLDEPESGLASSVAGHLRAAGLIL